MIDVLSQMLLKEGKAIKIRVTGLSMFPTVRSGDYVIVEPLNGQDPKEGAILFFKDEAGRLLLHRLVAVQEKEGQAVYLAQGDGYTKRLDWFSWEQILGVATFKERHGRRTPLNLKRRGGLLRGVAFFHYWLVRLKTKLSNFYGHHFD